MESKKRDFVAALLRFLLGSAVGLFASFWLGLISETLDKHLVVVAIVCGIVGGAAAQIPTNVAQTWFDRISVFLLGTILTCLAVFIVSRSFEHREDRRLCLDCCADAGYPDMVFAPEHRYGAWYCTCLDRTLVAEPQVDDVICMNASRAD